MYEVITTDLGKIAYKTYNKGGRSVLFCGGYGSEMCGYKATSIEEFCINNDISFTKFDYIGHGESSGLFLECNISIWLESAINILNIIKEEEVIVVGSSMGGWIALMLAQKFPNRIKALIGIAPAPDFTEDMYIDMNNEEKNLLFINGIVEINKPTSRYVVTKNLVFDGRKHLILNNSFIDINIPVSLFHSINDQIVDYKKSLTIMEKLTSQDVELTLIKYSDHSMNDNIDLFFNAIAKYIKK